MSPGRDRAGCLGGSEPAPGPAPGNRSIVAAMSKATRPPYLAVAFLVVTAGLFALAGADGWSAAAANESPIGEPSRWCERVSDGFFREPVNTLGNLGFVVAGLAMFGTLARDELQGRRRINSFIGNTPVALLYAAATLFLGPGSMAMHGSHTFAGAWLDNVSMVAYILVPWLYNVSRLGRWRPGTTFGVYGSLLGLYAAGYWLAGPDLGIGLDLFGLSIALWAVSEVVYRWPTPPVRAASGLVGFAVAAVFGVMPWEMVAAPGDYWWVVLLGLPGVAARGGEGGRRQAGWLTAGAGAFVAAYYIWLTGSADHPWCDPDSLFQAHAIWHLLGAAATWCFFLYFRSEAPKPISAARVEEQSPAG